MKICLISNLYKPFTRGGAEKVAEWTAEGLAKAGHEVVVVSTQPQFKKTTKQENNITIIRFKPMNLFYYLNDYKHNALIRLIWHFIDMFNLHSYFAIKKILKNEKPELIITENLKGIGYLIPLAIKKYIRHSELGSEKHIHVLHDVQLVVTSGLIIKNQEKDFTVNGFLTKWYTNICKKLFSSPDIIISPSEWLLNFYKEKGFFKNSKAQVIRNPLPPLDKNAILKPRHAEALRDRQIQPACRTGRRDNKTPNCHPEFISGYNLYQNIIKTNRQNRYLFIGQIEKHKGVAWLIDLWQKESVQSELLVVGDGSLNLNQEQLNSNIKLFGRIEGKELNKIFQKVDFLIMPSLCYENSPTVTTLAYQNATPVISADIGGAGELIKETETGFKFIAEDKDSFMTAFNRAKNINLEQFSRNCLEYSKEFRIENYLNSINKLI